MVCPLAPGLMTAVHETTAAHEARHAAAALLLGLPITRASIVPNLEQLSAGHVDFEFNAAHVAELTDEEAHDAAIMFTVGYVDDPDIDHWPPVWPKGGIGVTTDEWALALLARRLNLDAVGWQQLRDEAIKLAVRPDFEMLEESLSSLLQRDGVITADTLKAAHEIVTTGGPHMHTHTVEASAKTLKKPRTFSVLADVYQTRPRPQTLAIEETIATLQASTKSIPVVHGITGHHVGVADTSTMKIIHNFGLFFNGMFDDNTEARDMLSHVKRDRVAIGCADDLSQIVMHPKAQRTPRPGPPTQRDLEDRVYKLACDLHANDEPADRRLVLQVQTDAGVKHDVALETYDQMRKVLKTDRPASAELRKRAARLEAELALP